MEAFSYEPIDLERPAFRLLRLSKGEGPNNIECELFQAYLEGNDLIPYHALSYTWGGTAMSSAVTVNGRMLGVTENLYLALQYLRRQDRDRILWVDAICINQGNKKERGHQVQQMGKIYSQAKEVIIWLGPATYETNVIMDSLEELKNKSLEYACRDWKLTDERWTNLWLSVQPNLKRQHPGLLALQHKGLDFLFNRPWFERVWILQEVANAQRASVCSGTRSVPAYFFALAPLLMQKKPDDHCQAVLDIMPGQSRQGSWWNEKRDLYTLFQKFSNSKAGDPRDLVYALLGISSDARNANHLRPDYNKTVHEVICDSASFLLGYTDVSHVTLQSLIRTLPSLRKAYFDEDRTYPAYSIGRLETMKKEVQTAAGAGKSGKKMLKNLLEQYGATIPITEEVVVAAANNQEGGPEVMQLLLQQRGIEVEITEAVVTAAVNNQKSGLALMKLLLLQRGAELRGTDALLAAAKSEGSDKDIMTFLLDHRDADVQITQAVVMAAAKNEGSGKDIMTLLLNRRGADVQITKDVVMAAARNRRSSKDIMTLLLDHHRGADVQITQDVVIAAAKNEGSGKDIMTLLINRRGADVQITKDVVMAAARNWRSGKDIMTFLLDHRDADVQITKDVVMAAARNWRSGKDIMTLLLDRRGADVQITQEVVVAAARNRYNGEDIMTLLLNRRGADVQITEDVVMAAAKNEGIGKDIMTLLLAAQTSRSRKRSLLQLWQSRRWKSYQVSAPNNVHRYN